jgi:hypothetical protein
MRILYQHLPLHFFQLPTIAQKFYLLHPNAPHPHPYIISQISQRQTQSSGRLAAVTVVEVLGVTVTDHSCIFKRVKLLDGVGERLLDLG